MQTPTQSTATTTGFVSNQILKAKKILSYLIGSRKSDALSDKDSEIAKAWYSPSTLSDIHYYYNDVPGKSPYYNPFLRLS